MLSAQTLDININPDLSLNYNSYVYFEVTVKDQNNTHNNKSTSNKNRKSRIKWSDVDVTLEGGDYLKKGVFKIHSGSKLNEKGFVTLNASYDGLSVSKTIELTFNDIVVVNFNGKNAKKRKRHNILGNIGRMFANGMITHITGVEITPSPRKGKDGRKGGHAGMVIVKLDTVHINKQVILKATCEDKTHHKQAVAYVNPSIGELKIMAEGGKGGNGKPGERYDPEIHGPNHQKHASGGNGGRAGSGGYVEVYTDESTRPYLNAVVISTEAGFGGVRGSSGARHNSAQDGSHGTHGNVVFISKESLKASNSTTSEKETK